MQALTSRGGKDCGSKEVLITSGHISCSCIVMKEFIMIICIFDVPWCPLTLQQSLWLVCSLCWWSTRSWSKNLNFGSPTSSVGTVGRKVIVCRPLHLANWVICSRFMPLFIDSLEVQCKISSLNHLQILLSRLLRWMMLTLSKVD